MKIDWKSLIKKIPHRVQVARKRFFEVVWVSSFNKEDQLGETRFDPDQIVIKTDESNKETVHTFFHEIWHAVSDEYDLGLTEKQVQQLEKFTPYLLKLMEEFKK